jgi:putative transposase
MTRAERVAMIDRGRADLSVRQQCALLGLARSGVYCPPAAPDREELALMRWIDEQYLATPFYGSRRMTAELRLAGHQVNRKRVQRLMRLMGLEALGPKPKTSRPSAQGSGLHLTRPVLWSCISGPPLSPVQEECLTPLELRLAQEQVRNRLPAGGKWIRTLGPPG